MKKSLFCSNSLPDGLKHDKVKMIIDLYGDSLFDYQIGETDTSFASAQQEVAVYRAMQDIRGFILANTRSFLARH